MNYNEIEFLGEDELVEIIPNFSSKEEIELIQGSFGPFEVNLPIQIPLWIAITLRKKGKCKIQQPKWLDIEYLKEKIEEEKKNEIEFSRLSFDFIQNGLILLKICSKNGNDFEKIENIRILLEDLMNIREIKIKKGLLKIDNSTSGLEMANITCIEMNKYRQVISNTMKNLNKF